MDGHTLGLIEMLLVFGLVVGWGFWELSSLRRARERTQRALPPDDGRPDETPRKDPPS